MLYSAGPVHGEAAISEPRRHVGVGQPEARVPAQRQQNQQGWDHSTR